MDSCPLKYGAEIFPPSYLFFVLRKWHKSEIGDCRVRQMWTKLSSVTHQNLSLNMLLTSVGIWISLEALERKEQLPEDQ